jgi:hypothetical protein
VQIKPDYTFMGTWNEHIAQAQIIGRIAGKQVRLYLLAHVLGTLTCWQYGHPQKLEAQGSKLCISGAMQAAAEHDHLQKAEGRYEVTGSKHRL